MLRTVILNVIRFVVGGLFIFSGLIKVNDPVGTAIKLEEYFDVFSSDIASFFEYFKAISLPLAVFLVVVEVALGVMVILGWKIRTVIYLLLAMIVFFTFLTFYSAYFDKVTDCGCFGDAIKLTPWESFYKDIVLLVMILILFSFRNQIRGNSSRWAMWGSLLAFSLAIVLSVAAIRNLPFIDFRAYKKGVNIQEAMQPSAPLQYSYLMEKDDEVFVFDQYPADESYEFVEMKLNNPESLPKISDFSVWNEEGDFTDEILSGKKILILISNIEKMSHKSLDKIGKLEQAFRGTDVEVKLVGASSDDELKRVLLENGWDISYYLADATVVKNIIR
jgi:uncharacterized membrane protein YphA (DoxX/SURF4 family)